MIVLIQQKNTENMMSDLYFNEESDCEKNTNNNEVTFFNHFSLRLNRKMYVNESHEKETTEVGVLKILQMMMQENTMLESLLNKVVGL